MFHSLLFSIWDDDEAKCNCTFQEQLLRYITLFLINTHCIILVVWLPYLIPENLLLNIISIQCVSHDNETCHLFPQSFVLLIYSIFSTHFREIWSCHSNLRKRKQEIRALQVLSSEFGQIIENQKYSSWTALINSYHSGSVFANMDIKWCVHILTQFALK